MKNRFYAGIILVLLFLSFSNAYANSSLKDITVQNKLFAITLPAQFKNVYTKKIHKDKIEIFDKASKNAGFGGFAFGIKAYKNPSDYASMPGGKKIGELTDKKGQLYDVVLKHPTDVQYDYTKSSKAPEHYKLLYELGDNINIQGVKGATYFKNQGTKGQDLYKDFLKKHITAINEKWDSIKLEKENMSYMYNILRENKSPQDLLNKIGYEYYDMNGDGIEELLIGEIVKDKNNGFIFDIYTMKNRKPEHVISAGTRNRYYVCDDVFVCNEYSSGAMESGVRVYILLENSTELYPQVSFKYDAYTNPKNPWFISYGRGIDDDKWENMPKDEFNERKKVFDNYKKLNFIPLSKVEF